MLTQQLQTLKVYELEPRQKHPVIFEWFDKLQPAQSFIIENDHDPLPLYYELKAERNGKLAGFDYLQKGPEIWKVQITKARETEQSHRGYSTGGEMTNTPEEAGHSYNSCSTKKTVTDSTNQHEQYSASSTSKTNSSSDIVKILDVTKLEPRLKHPTIFEWFNELKPGESFALINDHDPKPLYYQMLAQLGYVFSWEYTEFGPVWWKVVIQKNKHGELTVGEIAAKDIRKAQTMKRLGVDFCCGGNKTINQAAAEAGIPAEDLQQALKETEYSPEDVNLAFDKWGADFLINYIYTRHHNYYYDTRENILQLAIKVRQVHGQNQPELVKLNELIEKLFRELNIHFYKEENVLFPYIEELVVYKKEGTRPRSQIALTQGPLAMMHMEHEEAGDILKEMRSITNDYRVPDHACSSFRLLYTELKDLENDLHQHIHLENNILFPKALQLEKELYSLD